jgi:hypothetical protein
MRAPLCSPCLLADCIPDLPFAKPIVVRILRSYGRCIAIVLVRLWEGLSRKRTVFSIPIPAYEQATNGPPTLRNRPNVRPAAVGGSGEPSRGCRKRAYRTIVGNDSCFGPGTTTGIFRRCILECDAGPRK